MNRPPPSSDELLAHPELAVLHALEATLTAAERALFAAHPELEEEDLCGDGSPRLSATGWIADAILLHVAGLTASLNRYTAEVRRERQRGLSSYPF